MGITDTFKVKCVDSNAHSFVVGEIYDVNVCGMAYEIADEDDEIWCYDNHSVVNLQYVVARFKPIDKAEHQTPLDKRKTGKLRLDLVDTGFPNALAALAEVMTWARESKGYLDDDWKNINEPFRALQGAASRHKNLRLQGVDFDEESGKLHLAHEAFNVLALLELKLTGKLED